MLFCIVPTWVDSKWVVSYWISFFQGCDECDGKWADKLTVKLCSASVASLPLLHYVPTAGWWQHLEIFSLAASLHCSISRSRLRSPAQHHKSLNRNAVELNWNNRHSVHSATSSSYHAHSQSCNPLNSQLISQLLWYYYLITQTHWALSTLVVRLCCHRERKTLQESILIRRLIA